MKTISYAGPRFGLAVCMTVLLLISGGARAQSGQGEGLGSIPLDSFANDIEIQAAIANQRTFDTLDAACNVGRGLDDDPNPTGPPQGADPQCVGDVFSIYLTIRELVHTANELLGVGPTAASLGLDQEGLGTALRWTAAEELAAQGSAASEFSNGQLSNLAARLNALRFGAQGFSIAGFNFNDGDTDNLVASTGEMRQRGGGASGDGTAGESYSPWGGFLNGSFGYGDKKDTDLENAFDFDGAQVTLGVDYRFQNNFILGGMLGWKRQTIDFDEAASDIRVVAGGIEVDGISGIVFGLYQSDRFYASGSLGYEKIDYDVERWIRYGSNNPNIGAANSVARSTPEGDAFTATLNVGYSHNVNRFTIEPYLNLELVDIGIDAFAEQRSVTALGNVDSEAFNLFVSKQDIKSLDAIAGLRFQYSFTPELGIIVPYARVEAHSELSNKSRLIFAGYGALQDSSLLGQPGLLTFAVPTDKVDTSFVTWSVGVSTVLRGGRQRQYGGPVMGGLMGFIQYESIEGLDNYEQQVISGGIRYEF